MAKVKEIILGPNEVLVVKSASTLMDVEGSLHTPHIIHTLERTMPTSDDNEAISLNNLMIPETALGLGYVSRTINKITAVRMYYKMFNSSLRQAMNAVEIAEKYFDQFAATAALPDIISKEG